MGLDIMVAGGAYVEMALAQLVINLRYALMSISLSQKVDSNFKTGSRLFYGFFMTDEMFGVAASRKGEVHRSYSGGLRHIAGDRLGVWNVCRGSVRWRAASSIAVGDGNCYLRNVFGDHHPTGER